MRRRFLLTLSVVFMAAAVFGCERSELIVTTPQWAENSYMSDDGRLFVTGGGGFANIGQGFIMEITRNEDGSYEGHEVYRDDSITFLGITAHEGYLYVNAMDGSEAPKAINKLFIACLNDISLDIAENISNGVFSHVLLGEFSTQEVIQEIIKTMGRLENIPVGTANGLGIDAKGYVYIADELGNRIIQCHITEDDPTQIENVKIWLKQQASYPNGIVINGNILYFTELMSGNVKKVVIGDNAKPVSVQTIYKRPYAVLDDLTFYKGGLIVVSFLDGVVIYLTDPNTPNEMGKVVFETALESFIFPTSITIGQPPMFQDGDVIVTEGSRRVSLATISLD